MMAQLPDRPEGRAGIIEVAKAVFSSFLGIRRRAKLESDAVRITPLQIVVAGLVGAVLFVLTIVLVVRLVLRFAGA